MPSAIHGYRTRAIQQERAAAREAQPAQKAEHLAQTQQALAQQAATAEVLKVIGSSVADAKPVFENICSSLERLLPGAVLALSATGDDGRLHWQAGSGDEAEALRRLFPRPAPGGLLTGEPSHWPDLAQGPDVPLSLRDAVQVLGRNASMLSAAMVSAGKVVGALSALRFDLRPFSERESRLLKTFAGQAVIAIRTRSCSARPRRRCPADGQRRYPARHQPLATDVQPVFEAIVAPPSSGWLRPGAGTDRQRRHLLAQGHGHPGRPGAGAGRADDAGGPGGQLPVAGDSQQGHAACARLDGGRTAAA